MITNTILLFFFTLIVVFMLFILLDIKNKFDNFFKKNHKNYFIKTSLVLGITFTVFSFFAPSFFASKFIKESNFFSQYTGFIGDTIGGITNPFIGIAGVAFTFLAFYMQKLANDDISKQFEVQQFESQLFEMINLYRKNADEMRLAKFNGRKCFAVMFEEFKFIYLEVEDYLSDYDINEKDLTSISYCIFYYGVGNNIKPILNQLYNKLEIDFNELIYRLEMVKNEFDYHGHVTLTNNLGDSISYIFKYKPFKGHLSRLGHYYRHLFQTVKYVIKNENIDYDKKYEYLKLLRCQISDYEYIFLFYNSLFEKGNEWLVLDIFTEYRFIKNIPLELLNFGLNPKDLFEETNSRNEQIFE